MNIFKKLCFAAAVFALFVYPAETLIAADTLTWENALSALYSGNRQKIQSVSNISVYEQKVKAARGQLFPQLSADGTFSKVDAYYNGAAESYSYGLSLNQPLFSPDKTAALRESLSGLKQAVAEDRELDAELSASLRTGFSELKYAQQLAELSENVQKRREANVDLIRLKYQAGRESKAALLETQALAKSAAWEHERDLKNLVIAQRRLNQLLGRDLLKPVKIDKSFDMPSPPKDFSAFSGLIEKHPALEAKIYAKEVSKAETEIYRSNFKPTAKLFGEYNLNGSRWPDGLNNWALGVSVNWPLFAGGKNKANLRAGMETLRKADTEILKTRDELYITAEDDFLSWREAASYLDVTDSMLEAVKERAWLVHRQYLSGEVTYFEWRDVETQLADNQKNKLSAEKQLADAYTAFVKSVGLGEIK